ncbi:MAG TPA: 50S ribosomal protein L11 methyltransferase, partial [Gammaproteobacteria bacterium]
MAHWLQVHVEVPAAQVEDASATFERAGALSVTVGDAADDPVYEPLPGEVRVWRHNRVTGLFPEGFDPLPLRGALAAALGGGPGGWRVEALAERDWERAWLDGFRPLRFGTRLWVVPSSFEPPAADAVNLRLDPGLAFGTGTHPTTALCLEWLDAAEPAATLLDYGCGSGILAIAGLLLGAGRAWAVDLDPQALLATRANAAANG